MTTRIEWADETWNPIVGCSPVSAGCENCYAARMASRNLHPDWKGTAIGGQWTGLIRLRRELLDLPARWKRPRRVFVSSMGDIFHESVLSEWIRDVGDAMRLHTRHTYLILTKRPKRAAQLAHLLPPSIWLGVSAEDQELAEERIPWLFGIGAARIFVSLEPLLGPVDLEGIARNARATLPAWPDWVIVGAETGPGARAMLKPWATAIRDQCVDAGVPFFFKRNSLGEHELDGRRWEEVPT